MLDKILNFIALSGTFAGFSVIHRLFEGMVSLMALVVMSAFMATITLLCFLAGFYLLLTNAGLAPVDAFLIIGGIIVVITSILIYITMTRLRLLHALSRNYTKNVPGVTRFGSIVDAFLEGFLEPRMPRHTRATDSD